MKTQRTGGRTWRTCSKPSPVELTCVPDIAISNSAVRPPSMSPATLLFDYGAAFPSLLQDFLWLCLAAIGFPVFIINAIKQLYVRNRHYWRFGGECRFVFTVMSGVKQGCPLSALLFVIAVDPFLRALHTRIGPGGLVRAYADDVGIVCCSIWIYGPGISLLYFIFTEVSNLKLKPNTCALIPLWKFNPSATKWLLCECLPDWASFEISG